MDIDQFNFWDKLPTMLKTISEAQYVAVDLKKSGIQTNKYHLRPVQLTLQEAYDDARMAAEMYTILQFGFTCINWEPKEKSYVTETYNIPLRPGVLVERDASRQFVSIVDRRFTLSTKSSDLLSTKNFSLVDIFHKGVPYLSADEFHRKETSDFIKGLRSTEDFIDIKKLPTKSAEFLNGVKDKITNWRSNGFAPHTRVYPSHGRRPNDLEKRLVQQLLQDKFPELEARNRKSESEGAYMEIFKPSGKTLSFDETQRETTVYKQIGARLLWDAICGQPFVKNIPPGLKVGDEQPFKDTKLRSELGKYESLLQNKSPVVIGHNILMDLCFLRSNFVAPLPKSLQEFRALARETMPRIVDIEYLFTSGGDEMSPDYSLSECFEAVSSRNFPRVLPGLSQSYSKPHHYQAGWDSYMIAVVFLKKSYQLCKADVLQPEGRPTAPATAPPTPEQSPSGMRPGHTDSTSDKFKIRSFIKSEIPPSPIYVLGRVPEWEGQFWNKYGKRSRVGTFKHILYFGKTTEEQLPGDEKTENPGTEILE